MDIIESFIYTLKYCLILILLYEFINLVCYVC